MRKLIYKHEQYIYVCFIYLVCLVYILISFYFGRNKTTNLLFAFIKYQFKGASCENWAKNRLERFIRAILKEIENIFYINENMQNNNTKQEGP